MMGSEIRPIEITAVAAGGNASQQRAHQDHRDGQSAAVTLKHLADFQQVPAMPDRSR
jgi:hypothetical protein